MQLSINLRAEFEAISAALSGVNGARIVLSIVKPEHFSEEVNQDILWAVERLVESDSEISIALVCDMLRLNERMKQDTITFVENAAAMRDVNPEMAATLVREHASRRDLSNLLKEQAAKLDSGESKSSDAAEAVTSMIFSVAAPGTQPSMSFNLVAEEQRTKLDKLQAGQVVGYTTSLSKVDKMLMGMQKSEFVMVTGPPGSCKSKLAQDMLLDNADKGHVCAGYILEMSRGEWFDRAVMRYTDLISDAKKFRGSLEPNTPAFSHEEFKEVIRVNEHLAQLGHDRKLFISDRKFTEWEIHEDIVRRIENDGLEIAMIDQAQLVKRGDGANRVNELEAISRGFRTLALRYNILVILLSKMNKAGMSSAFKGEEVFGTEMAGSSAFESDGSIVLSMMMRKPELICDCPDEVLKEYKERTGKPRHPTNEFIWCKDCKGPNGKGLIRKAPRRLGWVSIPKARGGEVDDRIPLRFWGAKLRLEEIDYERENMPSMPPTRNAILAG